MFVERNGEYLSSCSWPRSCWSHRQTRWRIGYVLKYNLIIPLIESFRKKNLDGRWDRKLVLDGMEVIAASVISAGEVISFFAETNWSPVIIMTEDMVCFTSILCGAQCWCLFFVSWIRHHPCWSPCSHSWGIKLRGSRPSFVCRNHCIQFSAQ